MMDVRAMLKICMSTIGSAVLVPDYNLIFILFLFIIYYQYKKNVSMQEAVYGKPKTPVSSLMITSTVFGIVAGIVVSIPMVLLGITFNLDMGIQYVLLVSVLLMFFDPRFMCFSYSGGVVALVGLICGIKSIDATGIMMLVGVLHLLESLLVFFDGYKGAVPVLLEREDGSVVGGFSMQRFWPLPIALIMLAGFNIKPTGSVVSTPDWWPIIKPYMDPSKVKDAIFTAAPIAAILGYSEFTSSSMPAEKCRRSALKLSAFSIILVLLSLASSYIYAFKYIAAIFAPLGHELLLMGEKKKEHSSKPIFQPEKFGVRVLDTIPDSPAEKMGIMPGDKITAINSKPIVTEDGLESFLNSIPSYIWIDAVDRNGEKKVCEYRDFKDGITNLGILTSSRTRNSLVVMRERKGALTGLLGRLINRDR